MIEAKAESCGHCGGRLGGTRQHLREAYDHIDILPVEPSVTRIHLFGGVCPHCARRFKAPALTGMAPGSPFGVKLRAMAIYLRYTQGIGLEDLPGCCATCFR